VEPAGRRLGAAKRTPPAASPSDPGCPRWRSSYPLDGRLGGLVDLGLRHHRRRTGRVLPRLRGGGGHAQALQRLEVVLRQVADGTPVEAGDRCCGCGGRGGMVLHQQLLLLQQIDGAGPRMLQRMRVRMRMRMVLRGQRAGGSAHGDLGFGGTGRTHCWRAEH